MTSLQRGDNPDPFVSQNFSLKCDKEVRLGFVRKVYGILSAQMLCTTAFCLFACIPNLGNFKGNIVIGQTPADAGAAAHSGFFFAFQQMLFNTTCTVFIVIGYFASICGLVCCRLDKKVPTNYLLLSIFTFCTSWLVATACARTKPLVVLEAAGLTFAMTVAITIYAMTTKTDFTIYGPLLFIFSFVFCVAGFFLAIFGFQMGLLWSAIGVILFSFYLLFDT